MMTMLVDNDDDDDDDDGSDNVYAGAVGMDDV